MELGDDAGSTARLAAENETLRKDLADTKWENEELSVLVEDYSSVMAKVLEGLRVYAVGSFRSFQPILCGCRADLYSSLCSSNTARQ